MQQSSTLSPPVNNVLAKVMPITLAVFIAFLTIGIQLPTLPLHLHDTLGMNSLVVGLVVGAQFAVALLSRSWAGNYADMRGPKRAVLIGTMVAASAGLLYLVSLPFVVAPALSLGWLLAGRLVLALGESLIVTGSIGGGIGLAGPQNAGKVMAWNGMAIYGAFALGAPAGVMLKAHWGFAGVALSSVGFGVITACIALLFAAKDWGNASMAFTAFGAAFIAARIFFGHLPDKAGGARVALICVLIEAAGQLLIWGATSALLANLGAALTGFGYSLAFPGFGVEALRRAPPQSRSLAMGAYVAFLDLALGITSPLAGGLANAAGVESVYLAAAIAVALSVSVALGLLLGGGKPTLSA